jgi:hypothetical protein
MRVSDEAEHTCASCLTSALLIGSNETNAEVATFAIRGLAVKQISCKRVLMVLYTNP